MNPLLPFLEALTNRGHECLVVGPPGIAELVEARGYRFRAGGEAPEEAVAPLRDLLARAPAAEASVLGNRELFGRLATNAMLPEMERAFSEWSPEFVLREPSEYSSAVIAMRRGVPAAQVAISLAEVEEGSIAVAAPALEEHQEGLIETLSGSPYLTRFPASFDPSSFSATIRYREPVAPPTNDLPAWLGEGDRPLVYMTFGTVLGHMSFAANVYRAALLAVEQLDVRVLLAVGRRFDPEHLAPIPSNVHVERWVDQAEVLVHTDVAVCHGGSGTVLGALSAGVPIVVVPVFADQFENGRHIASVGAGRYVPHEVDESARVRHPPDISDAPRIAQALAEVLADSRFGVEARRVAVEIQSTPPVSEVLDRLVPEI